MFEGSGLKGFGLGVWGGRVEGSGCRPVGCSACGVQCLECPAAEAFDIGLCAAEARAGFRLPIGSLGFRALGWHAICPGAAVQGIGFLLRAYSSGCRV